jgi:hypothetical protein
MDALWVLAPILCIVLMLSARRGNKHDRGWCGGDHHNRGTGRGRGELDEELRRRATAAGLSPADVERFRRILGTAPPTEGPQQHPMTRPARQ